MVIIESYQLDVWQQFTTSYSIFLPSSVFRLETQYYIDKTGEKLPIDLETQVSTGVISELEADIVDVQALAKVFSPLFLSSLHIGELEALALFYSGKHKDCKFCTADAPAIKALAMLRLPHLGISFESALKQIGITKVLKFWFKEDFFSEHIKRGNMNLITGENLLSSYLKSLGLS
jgi:hypothetical protein